jgi:hypothetical protein
VIAFFKIPYDHYKLKVNKSVTSNCYLYFVQILHFSFKNMWALRTGGPGSGTTLDYSVGNIKASYLEDPSSDIDL